MTTEPAPPPPPAPERPETADAVNALPPLPNPAHPRNAGPMLNLNADEALRVMRLLHDGASNGAVDFPYPTTTTEYPLPPLPAVPVPSRTGASRRPRPPPASKAHPVTNPPLPDSHALAKATTLDDAVRINNALAPPMPASLHYGRSALLVHVPNRGYCWALLRTLDGELARDVMCLSVRYFPTRAPKGPANITSEQFSGLKLSVPRLLWRLRATAGVIDMNCFYCGKHLSDLDGLPMGKGGFLPGPRKDDEGDGAMAVDGEEGVPEGKWVCWHPKCEE